MFTDWQRMGINLMFMVVMPISVSRVGCAEDGHYEKSFLGGAWAGRNDG